MVDLPLLSSNFFHAIITKSSKFFRSVSTKTSKSYRRPVPRARSIHPSFLLFLQDKALNILNMNNCFRLTVAFLALLFVSCSGVEQSDNQKEDNNLIGIWLCTESPAGYKDCYYTFQEDGKLVRDYDPNSSESTVYVYNADAKTITTTLEYNQETFQVVSLTSSSMELMGGGFNSGSWKFQKATSVSFPELKVEEGQEITIKVGETKKLNLSGAGIGLFTLGYFQQDGFLSDTHSDYVLKVDNETLSITGQYVGKCKLVIDSKNGKAEIPVVVEPNYPLWEHRYIIDKVKELNINSIVQELGFDYTTLTDNFYLFDNISDKIISIAVSRPTANYLVFAISTSQKDYLNKSLQEYGPSSDGTFYGTYLYHNNSATILNPSSKKRFETFLARWCIEAHYCDEAIILFVYHRGGK